MLPLQHPLWEVVLLVEHAGNDDDGRDSVEDREHTDTEHQLLQLVSLGTILENVSQSINQSINQRF